MYYSINYIVKNNSAETLLTFDCTSEVPLDQTTFTRVSYKCSVIILNVDLKFFCVSCWGQELSGGEREREGGGEDGYDREIR